MWGRWFVTHWELKCEIFRRCSKAGKGWEFTPIGLGSWNCSRVEEEKAHTGQSHPASPIQEGTPGAGDTLEPAECNAAVAFQGSLLPCPPTSPLGADLEVRPLYPALSNGRISMKAEEEAERGRE